MMTKEELFREFSMALFSPALDNIFRSHIEAITEIKRLGKKVERLTEIVNTARNCNWVAFDGKKEDVC